MTLSFILRFHNLKTYMYEKNIISFVFLVILTSCLANVTRHNFMPQKSLYGYWSLEGVTWLKITSDSIYFVDEEGTSPIKYSINKDTIIWYFDGIIQKSKYNIVQDTLFMKNEEGTTQYIRVDDKR